ncbi:MAG: S4 domain-containing protein [Erythrobacter sp.]|jgi:ribosome-associated heat shock protein Hsp15|nr:S4 domain-containing protein [Erythrobacter sp.]
MEEGAGTTMRLDRLLVYLRFARTRSAARALIESRALRRNRNHVRRASENVAIGDVLTLPVGGEIRVVEVLSLPDRRTSPALAKCHYRELDPRGEIAIAPGKTTSNDMKAPQ